MTEFSFNKVWIIAKREYLERVRTRSFLLSTFVTPLLMATFLVVPTWISTSTARGIMRDTERPARVVIASDNRALAELGERRIDAPARHALRAFGRLSGVAGRACATGQEAQ